MNSKIMCTALASLALTLTGLQVEAKIYKTVDANGNVVFTDIPPKDEAETVIVTEQNSYTPVVTAPAGPAAEVDHQPGLHDMEAPETVYEHVQIISPTNELDFRANDGKVTVQSQIEPELDVDRGHALQLLLDGKIATTTTSTSAQLLDVERGTHVLVAQVVDEAGAVLYASNPITFHLKRVSAIAPLGPQRPGGAVNNAPAPNRAPNVPPRNSPPGNTPPSN